MQSAGTDAIRLYGAPDHLIADGRKSRLLTGALGVDVVSPAVIPLPVRHSFKDFDGGHVFDGWKAGVYDDDGAVCASSLLDRHWTSVTTPFSPDDARAEVAEVMPVEAVYGGILFHHFGHFLLESTSRLWWPLTHDFDGPIVFQDLGGDGSLPDYAASFFELLGIAQRVVVLNRAVKFDRIIVPHRSFIIQKAIHPDFRIPFLRAGEAADPDQHSSGNIDAAGLFLSRLNWPFRRSIGEKKLEDDFATNGFRIVHIETLPLKQQIIEIRRHAAIAGVTGSAFHNLLFSSDAKDATYICRDPIINLNFFLIDEVMSNKSAYIYGIPEDVAGMKRSPSDIVAAYPAETTLDLGRIYELLRLAKPSWRFA